MDMLLIKKLDGQLVCVRKFLCKANRKLKLFCVIYLICTIFIMEVESDRTSLIGPGLFGLDLQVAIRTHLYGLR